MVSSTASCGTPLSSSNFGGNTTVFSTPVPVTPTTLLIPGNLAPTNLSSGILNEGTFIAATGSDFRRTLSRLTIDGVDYNSSSVDRNTQFSAFTILNIELRRK